MLTEHGSVAVPQHTASITWSDDHTSSLSATTAAATGTTGNSMTGVQRPLEGGCGAGAGTGSGDGTGGTGGRTDGAGAVAGVAG